MNERIKQLAKQAEEYADIEYNASDLDWYELKEEKFAELIVRDCMDIARQVGNISDPEDFALDRCYEIEQKIQDRFGVEE